MTNFSQKSILRKIAKQKRGEAFSQNPDAGLALASNFPISINAGDIVSGFIAIQSEINPMALMVALEKQGAKLCLPRIDEASKTIDFLDFSFGDELIEGPMGTLEPRAEKTPLIPNIMLVPFLAFDKNGYRLGYGGGFYDKKIAQLAQNNDLITIGIGFDNQLIDEVPIEPHDKPLDYVLTEKQIFKFRK